MCHSSLVILLVINLVCVRTPLEVYFELSCSDFTLQCQRCN